MAYKVSTNLHGPTVTIRDSAVLEELDSLSLGPVVSLARGHAGEVFIGDLAGGRVLRYGRDGRITGVFGRSGDGPGEFRMPATLSLVANDSLLAVVDPRRGFLSLLDATTGAYLRGFPVPFQIGGQDWGFLGDTAVFSVFPGRSLFAKWDWHTESVALLGAVPDALLRDANITAMYGWPEVAVAGEDLALAFPTEPGIRILRRDGSPKGFVMVPAARRRGTPPDLMDRHRKGAAGPAGFQYLGSSPAGLFGRSTGELMVANVDVERTPAPRGMEYRLSSYFLTVLSPDLRKACVDAAIPVRSDAISLPLMARDTLYMLSRLVTDSGTVRMVLYSLSVSTRDCDWVPTGGLGKERPT